MGSQPASDLRATSAQPRIGSRPHDDQIVALMSGAVCWCEHLVARTYTRSGSCCVAPRKCFFLGPNDHHCTESSRTAQGVSFCQHYVRGRGGGDAKEGGESHLAVVRSVDALLAHHLPRVDRGRQRREVREVKKGRRTGRRVAPLAPYFKAWGRVHVLGG